MNEAILNSVQLLVVINDRPTCLGYKSLYESICANGDADADETLGTEICKGDVPSEGSESGPGVGLLVMMFCATFNAASWAEALGEE